MVGAWKVRPRRTAPARLLLVGTAMVAALLSGCGTAATTSAAGQTFKVLVDYSHDETALSAFDYFPKVVEARPGDTIEFKQAWTGEPHSVTLGTHVSEQLEPLLALFAKLAAGEAEIPEEEPEEFKNFTLPFAFGDGDVMVQQAAQPCFVEAADFTGEYPGDEATPCPVREQPAFTGQPIYNSGIIPFEGVGGNTFEVELGEDLEPGTYSYYCNVHGPLQWGKIVVKEPGTEVASPSAVVKQGRQEAERWAKPMVENHRLAKQGKKVAAGEPGEEIEVETAGKNLIGVPTPFFKDGTFLFGVVNEFVPRDMKAKTGQPVTWTFAGHHTLSFNVPKYFPVFTIDDDGTVALNPQASPPAGWPGPPERDGPPGGGPDGEGEAAGPDEGGEGGGPGGPPPPPASVEVEWDGQGFKSTGLEWSDGDTFTITFTEAGTYPFACLIHPQMVGKIVVS